MNMIFRHKYAQLLLSSIVCMMFASCTAGTKENIEVVLPDLEVIYSHDKNVSVDLYRPAKIFIYKDKLVVYDNIETAIFKVFKRDDLEYLYSFGKTGQGPEDFIFTDKELVNASSFCFEILDRNNLYRYHLDETRSIRDTRNLIVAHDGPINNFKRLSDNLYIHDNSFTSGTFKKELALFDAENIKTTEFSDVIFFDAKLKEKTANQQYSALLKTITVHPENRHFATFYYHYPYFKIFAEDLSFQLYHIAGSNFQDNEQCIYFTEAYATNKYIYVLWIGKSKGDVMQDLNKYRPQLLIFDWQGNIIRNYTLDIPAITFAVDSNDAKLYAVSFNESDINRLYIYDLPNLNDKYIRLKNNFYSFNIAKEFHFIEDENRNIIIERDNHRLNACYLGQDLKPTHKKLGSIRIDFQMPKKDSLFHPQTQMREILNEVQTNGNNVYINNIPIGNKNVTHCRYNLLTKEYNGDTTRLFFNEFLFPIDKCMAKIKFVSTTNDIDEYLDDFKETVASFSLNKE